MHHPFRPDLEQWNLKEIVRQLVTQFPCVQEVYIFGSRAYRTNSYRSDIDLLVYSDTPLVGADVLPWLRANFRLVDLFLSTDKRSANSLINGSTIFSTSVPVDEKLEAQLLWSLTEGFSSVFDNWEQWAIKDADFAATILPLSQNFAEVARSYHRKLEELGFPDTHLGFDWTDIAIRISEIVENAVHTIPNLRSRKSVNISPTLKISSEYDFQNLIYLVLKPFIPSIEQEPFLVKYAGQSKNADFAISGSDLIVETKYVKDASTLADTVKSISGLDELYRINPSVKCVLFLILVEADYEIDQAKLENDYSKTSRSPSTVVRFVFNN